MPVSLSASKLSKLLHYLDSLTERAPLEALERHLRSLDLSVADVSEYAQFDKNHYRRNLVRGTSWYHLLVICWRSGQRSPIHNHAESTCGLKVLRGIATETKFETTPSSLLKAVTSVDLTEGHTTASQDSDIHQISNLQADGTDLITLHIYSPPLLRMKTFSLTDRAVGEYVPEIFEHGFGSGI